MATEPTPLPFDHFLLASGAVKGLADAASKVTVTVDGVEIT